MLWNTFLLCRFISLIFSFFLSLHILCWWSMSFFFWKLIYFNFFFYNLFSRQPLKHPKIECCCCLRARHVGILFCRDEVNGEKKDLLLIGNYFNLFGCFAVDVILIVNDSQISESTPTPAASSTTTASATGRLVVVVEAVAKQWQKKLCVCVCVFWLFRFGSGNLYPKTKMNESLLFVKLERFSKWVNTVQMVEWAKKR